MVDISNYHTEVFWSEEDAAFIGVCEEFPTISAFGDTFSEAREELMIVLSGTIEVYLEHGWELPYPVSGNPSKTIPEYMKKGYWQKEGKE